MRCSSCGADLSDRLDDYDWPEAALDHLSGCDARDDRVRVAGWTMTPTGPTWEGSMRVEIAWTGTRSPAWNAFHAGYVAEMIFDYPNF